MDARDNALVVGPVYNLGGALIATDFADMWDGSLLAPIRFNESGDAIPGVGAPVWTGSLESGHSSEILHLGSRGGAALPAYFLAQMGVG